MLARGGKRSQSAPVETVGKRNDFPCITSLHHALIASCNLDGGLVALRTGIAEEHLARMACGQQLFRVVELLFLIEKIAHVNELSRLSFHDLGDFLVAVAETYDGYAGQKIDIFLAVHIPEAGALAPDYSQRIPRVRPAHEGLFSFLQSFESFAHRLISP